MDSLAIIVLSAMVTSKMDRILEETGKELFTLEEIKEAASNATFELIQEINKSKEDSDEDSE